MMRCLPPLIIVQGRCWFAVTSHVFSYFRLQIPVEHLVPRRECTSGPSGGDVSAEQQKNPVLENVLFRNASGNSLPGTEPSLYTKGSWQEYFTSPSQLWDNISLKTNPSAPNFRHNSNWVKDMLGRKIVADQRSSGMHGGKVLCGNVEQEQVWSNSEEPGLRCSHHCMDSFMSGIQSDMFGAQKLQGASDWQKLSLEETFCILDHMDEPPSVDKFICILQKCRKRKDLTYAKRLHVHICNNGLQSHRAVGNYIVPMFVECGSLSDAQQIFNQLVYRNEHSWTSLISGYLQCGQSQHALNLYQTMQENGVQPSTFTLVPLLKTCALLKYLEKGQEIHVEITQNGFETDLVVANTLISMYAKCGSLAEAQKTFDKLPARDIVSWNALITGYAEHGPGQEALKCFEQMQLEGHSPDDVSLVCALKACTRIGAIHQGREIHMEITQQGFEKDFFIISTLVDMYAKFGSLLQAREVFDQLSVREHVLWTALIAGYAKHGPVEEALKCFEQMQCEGISPDAVTLVCVLKASGIIGSVDKGRELHEQVAEKRYENDPFVCSALVDMYVKCGSLSEAWEVFASMTVQEVVSWTALIAGYAEHGHEQEALNCFEQMQLEGISPNSVTYVTILKACGSMKCIEKGQKVHMEITRKGFETDHVVGNALVDMYAKCLSLLEAQEVFGKLPVREVVSWTALIAGYSEQGPCQQALKCFEQMQWEGVPPDAFTFACALKACGSMGARDKGQEIHTELTREGFELDLFVGNTLVDMYAKCGSPSEAQEVFAKLLVQDVVSWNALIAGYAMNHDVNLALQCFEDMQDQGFTPDGVTFTCVLTACSRASLVFKGQEYFKLMEEEYGIAPTVDHCTCMVDLLARSGHLGEAEKFLETVRCFLSDGTWRALLGGCKTYGEADLGMRCFQQLFQMNPANAASYVLMADIYANAGKWDDAYAIEELRKHVRAKKKPASALIEVNREVHEFVVGDNQSKQISLMLENLSLRTKEIGHVPNQDMVLRDISDVEKGAALCEHAEKMAIAFGLLNTPQGQTLRVTKNLRMCNDCHNVSKVISKIEKREIIVRDICCVHHFRNGLCSCRDMF